MPTVLNNDTRMRTRDVGADLPLTELGLGMAQFGNLYRQTTDGEAAGAIEAAWASGIRYFDTAPHYGLGLSEQRAGTILGQYLRDEYVLSTKVGRLLVDNPGGEPSRDDEFDVPASKRRIWDLSRDGIRRSIGDSLERLSLDRIDIAYLHDPDEFEREALDQALPALCELRAEGVLRAVGVGMNQSAMPARFVRESDLDVVMIAGRFTLLDQSAIADLIPVAEDRGVALVAAGVYNSGLLSSARPSPDARYDYAPADADVVERANRIADVCETFDTTLPEAAIAFALQQPTVASVVLGARTAAQVASNVSRYRAQVPAALWRALVDAGLVPLRCFPAERLPSDQENP